MTSSISKYHGHLTLVLYTLTINLSVTGRHRMQWRKMGSLLSVTNRCFYGTSLLDLATDPSITHH